MQNTQHQQLQEQKLLLIYFYLNAPVYLTIKSLIRFIPITEIHYRHYGYKRSYLCGQQCLSHERENWNSQFQGLAVSLSVWELIEGTKVPLTKPVIPHISSYHRQSAREERETRQATATASSSQDSEPQESQSTVQSVGPVAL